MKEVFLQWVDSQPCRHKLKVDLPRLVGVECSDKFTVQGFFYKQIIKGGLIYKKLQREFVFYVGAAIDTGGKLEPSVTMEDTASHSGGTGERGEGVPPLMLAGQDEQEREEWCRQLYLRDTFRSGAGHVTALPPLELAGQGGR